MKRYLKLPIALLLVSAFMLSSCGRVSEDLKKKRAERENEESTAVSETTEVTETTESAAPTATSTPTPSPTPEPTPEPMIVTVESGIYPEDDIPVYVDWDNYEQNTTEKTENIYKKDPATVTKDFVPSDDYKAVFPYLGSSVTYMEPNLEDSYLAENLFGICTSDGTIVSEPFFKSYFQFSKYYVVSVQDGDNEKYGLLSIDGKTYTGCIYDKAYSVENEKIELIKDSSAIKTYTAYLPDGTVISSEMPFKIDESSLSEDNYLIDDNLLWLNERYATVHSNNGIRLLDTQTGKINNDFLVYSGFSNGNVIAYTKSSEDDKNEYYLAAPDGTELTPHAKIIQATSDRFFAGNDSTEKTTYTVYDIDGNEITKIDALSKGIRAIGSYYLIKTGSTTWDLMDHDFNTVRPGIDTEGKTVMIRDAKDLNALGKGFIKTRKDELLDPETGYSYKANDDYYTAYKIDDGYLLISSKEWVRLSEDLVKIDGEKDSNTRGIKYDRITGKLYVCYASKDDKEHTYIYDVDTRDTKELDCNTYNLDIIDGKVCYFNFPDKTTTITDIETGEILFRYTAFTTLSDD